MNYDLLVTVFNGCLRLKEVQNNVEISISLVFKDIWSFTRFKYVLCGSYYICWRSTSDGTTLSHQSTKYMYIDDFTASRTLLQTY